MSAERKGVCRNCKDHRYDKAMKFWFCGKKESDDYMQPTPMNYGSECAHWKFRWKDNGK